MRFKLSRPYLNIKTHCFERLVLGEGRIRFIKAKLGGSFVRGYLNFIIYVVCDLNESTSF
jgi:hypothetical protein